MLSLVQSPTIILLTVQQKTVHFNLVFINKLSLTLTILVKKKLRYYTASLHHMDYLVLIIFIINPSVNPRHIVNSLMDSIQDLLAVGAKNFLIFNQPSLQTFS
jgi:hypothetical protein